MKCQYTTMPKLKSCEKDATRKVLNINNPDNVVYMCDEHASLNTQPNPRIKEKMMNVKQTREAKDVQVQAQMGVLNNNLSELNHALAELKGRLAIVLREEVAKDDSEAPPIPLLVPLAADIRDFNDQVNTMTSEVIGMLEKLEL